MSIRTTIIALIVCVWCPNSFALCVESPVIAAQDSAIIRIPTKVAAPDLATISDDDLCTLAYDLVGHLVRQDSTRRRELNAKLDSATKIAWERQNKLEAVSRSDKRKSTLPIIGSDQAAEGRLRFKEAMRNVNSDPDVQSIVQQLRAIPLNPEDRSSLSQLQGELESRLASAHPLDSDQPNYLRAALMSIYAAEGEDAKVQSQARAIRATIPECPYCTSKDVSGISYGYPSQYMFAYYHSALTVYQELFPPVLGGCVWDNKKWFCNDCRKSW